MGGRAVNHNLLSFTRSEQPTALEPLHYTACGLDNVYLLNGFEIETVDGEEFVTIEDMDGLWKAIGLNLVLTRKELAPKEIRFLRHRMDLTQLELAEQMRVTDQTVARWEKGLCDLSGPADVVLRVLFLSSKIAQPEGGEIVSDLLTRLRKIIELDDLAKPAVFEHGKRKWKESKRELALA
jgi:DNA-binding transcriptional regulator YiaG